MKLEADVTVASGALCSKVVGEIRESGPGGGRVGQQQHAASAVSLSDDRAPGRSPVWRLSLQLHVVTERRRRLEAETIKDGIGKELVSYDGDI